MTSKPGAGKTTLLNYALQESKGLLNADKLMVASYFFDGRGAPIQKNPLGLFRSLLFQILNHFPDLLSEFGVFFKNKVDTEGGSGKKWEWSLAEMRKHLSFFLSRASKTKYIRIYVDALDESGEEPAREMVSYFRRLTSPLPATECSISICFSCRNYPLNSVEDSLTICVEDENYTDIVMFVVDKLNEFPHDQAKKLSVTIVTRASGVFQWVVLVVPKLLRLYRQGKNMKVIEAKLLEIPLELGNFYQEILEDVDKDDLPQSLQLMQWLCFSLRPLTLEELRWAMAVDANSSYDSLDECKSSEDWVETDDAMANRLNYLSGGLAEVVFAEILESEYEGSDDGKGNNEKIADEEIDNEGIKFKKSHIEDIDGEKNNEDESGKADPWDPSDNRSAVSPIGKEVRRVAQFVHQSVEDYLISSGLEKLDNFAKRSVIGRGHHSLLRACIKYISMQEVLSFAIELENRPPSGSKLLSLGGGTGTGESEQVQRGLSEPLLNARQEKAVENKAQIGDSGGTIDQHLQNGKPILSIEPQEEKPAEDDLHLIVSGVEEDPETQLLRLAIELQRDHARVRASGGESSQMGARREQALADDSLLESSCPSDSQQFVVYEASKQVEVPSSPNPSNQVEKPRICDLPYQVHGDFLDTHSDTDNDSIFRDISDDHRWDMDRRHVVTDSDRRDRDRRRAKWHFPLLHYAVKYCILHAVLAEEQQIPQGNLVDLLQTPKLASKGASPHRQLPGSGVSRNKPSDQMIIPWRCLYNLMGVLSSNDKAYVPANIALLHVASRHSLISVVAELLDPGHNIDADPKDSNGWTPLFYAVQHGHDAVARLLLDTGRVNPDTESNDRWTPLSLAAKYGREAVMQMLLDTGEVDVDRKDEMGRTALFWASRFGNEAVVQLLLNTGKVDVNLKENTGHTLLSWATEELYQPYFKLPGGYSRLQREEEHTAIVQLLLNTGKIDMGKNEEGQTLLSTAAEKGHDILVQQLLKTGKFEVDSKDSRGQTPLSLAAYNGHETVVKLLLKTGRADVNSKDDKGRTPLSLALSWVAYIKTLKPHGDEDEVRLRLATRKLNIKSEDITTWTSRLTPFSLATDHLAVARLLLDTGKIPAGLEDEWVQPPPEWIAIDEREDEDMKAAQAASLAKKKEEDEENAELEAALAVSLLRDDDEDENNVYFRAAIAASLAKKKDEEDQLTLAIAVSLAKDNDEAKEGVEYLKAAIPASLKGEKSMPKEGGRDVNDGDYNNDDDLELAIALSLALADDIEELKQVPQNSVGASRDGPVQEFMVQQVGHRSLERKPAAPAPKPKPEHLTQASPERQSKPTPQPKPEHPTQPFTGPNFKNTKPIRLSPEPKPKPKHLTCTEQRART